jgi:hypothetical protein
LRSIETSPPLPLAWPTMPSDPFERRQLLRCEVGLDLDRLRQPGGELLAQARVDLPAQLVAGHDVHDHRREHHGRRHRAGGQQHGAAAEAHRVEGLNT